MSNVHGMCAQWSYLPLAMPVGAAEALWQFDGTANNLADRAGNGHDLTLTAGTACHAYSAEGLHGLGFAAAEYYTAALPTNLRITAALTVELQFLSFDQTAGGQFAWVSCNGLTEVLADNCLYRLAIPTIPSTQYYCEYGAGTDVVVGFNSLPTRGRIELFTLTRTAAGAVSLYQNGTLVSGPTAAHVPEGGTSAQFCLGHDRLSAAPAIGLVFSCRISAQELTAAQVLAVYEDVSP